MRTNSDLERQIFACFQSYAKLRLKTCDLTAQRGLFTVREGTERKEKEQAYIYVLCTYTHTHKINMQLIIP